jgi:hypothetical protein
VEVRFTYAYQALIKAGIALVAHRGQVKVRGIPGHHVQLLSKTSELLNMPDVETIGNAMRTKRNLDLYEGGTLVSEKECADYVDFGAKIVERVAKELDLKSGP